MLGFETKLPPMPKSKRGALRQRNAIIRAYKRAFAGGGSFGFDWPTFRLNWPEGFQRAVQLKLQYPYLPK